MPSPSHNTNPSPQHPGYGNGVSPSSSVPPNTSTGPTPSSSTHQLQLPQLSGAIAAYNSYQGHNTSAPFPISFLPPSVPTFTGSGSGTGSVQTAHRTLNPGQFFWPPVSSSTTRGHISSTPATSPYFTGTLPTVISYASQSQAQTSPSFTISRLNANQQAATSTSSALPNPNPGIPSGTSLSTNSTTSRSTKSQTPAASRTTSKRSSKSPATLNLGPGNQTQIAKVPKLRITRTRTPSATQSYQVINPTTTTNSTSAGTTGVTVTPVANQPAKAPKSRGRPRKQTPSSTTTSTNVPQFPAPSPGNQVPSSTTSSFQQHLNLNVPFMLQVPLPPSPVPSVSWTPLPSHPILALPLAQYPRYITTSSPPLPPRWDDFCKEALQTSPLSTYVRVPLDSSSSEYSVLSAMIQASNITVSSIEKVSNREIWKKFLNHRKECLISKSRNLNFLTKLGVGDDELATHANLNLNFQENAAVAKVEYTDNIALLYHCTKTNVNIVLEQGLDERVGNGGLLGRGIYFTDDPNKAISYDTSRQTLLIFAVFLGDCLGLDNSSIQTAGAFTREPLKQKNQQRNFRDTFFDSIVGRPNTANEFVIYNRYQCVPIYVVTYSRVGIGNSRVPGNALDSVRSSLPPFAWIKGFPTPLSNPYPFFAQTVFKLMAIYDTNPSPSTSANALLPAPVLELPDDGQDENMEIAINLSLLTDLGFLDDAKNIQLLKKHSFNVSDVINELVDEAAIRPTTSAGSRGQEPKPGSSKRPNDTNQATADLGIPKDIADWILSINVPQKDFGNNSPSTSSANVVVIPEKEECPICMEEFPSVSKTSWIKLSNCTHKLCSACHKRMSTTGTTMSGITHTFLKCPFCQACSGIQTGTCPDGVMTESQVLGPMPTDSWIQIQYSVNHSQYSLNRIAFLPNTNEGREALLLLRIAFDRRLTFSIGTSVTTGQTNTLVWNIHHKTNRTGGTSNFGYPDPTYFLRLRQELKQFGVDE